MFDHFGLSVALRNAWGLWSESPLAKYFERMGVSNADDMSLIVVTSFHRHLNGQEIRLEQQINRLKFSSRYCRSCYLRYGLVRETFQISEVLQGKMLEVTVEGWLHHKRSEVGVLVLIVSDGSGLIRCAVKKEAVGEGVFQEIEKLPLESVILVTGTRREYKGAFHEGCEILAKEIRILRKTCRST